ncbi:cobalt-precorrin-6A reductase [Aestuariivirga sp.]|jgi:precorrin-6A/cobalt-precorrin-6A reductase|uniref:cobalt-precorrin-6A reductase n=1 Tax=Aestuariivirga sp. TaxID=2650926 RepID=UPI00378340B4
MPASPVLILGGTRDAREIARILVGRGHDVVTSLAGVTSSPERPAGRLRTGGFGGVEGLRSYLESWHVSLVIDATHPFAAQISRHAHAACVALGVPLLRLDRPAWQRQAGDLWIEVGSAAEAAAALPAGARCLLAIGRKELAPFFRRNDISGVARMIEAPADDPPAGWIVLRERPPFSVQSEMQLMRGHQITHLVSKNAGGALGREKLDAARMTQSPVIMMTRPEKPEAPGADTVAALVAAVGRQLSP